MTFDKTFISARHPLLAIWSQPRATIRRIVDNDPEYWVIALTVVAGVAQASLEVAGRWESLDISLPLMVVLVMLGGAVRGFVTLYIEGWLLGTVGRWLDGSASSEEVRAAIAWSNLPLVASAVCVWLLMILQMTAGLSEIYAEAVFVVLLLWNLIMLTVCLATVQRFSLKRSVMSIAGAALLLTAIAAVLMLIAWAPFYMLMEGGGLLTMGEATS